MWNIDTILTYLNIDLSRLRDVFLYDPQAPMIFSSGLFLWLFAAFVVVYLLLQRRTTARLLFVTLFSAGVGYSQRLSDSSLHGADGCEMET